MASNSGNTTYYFNDDDVSVISDSDGNDTIDIRWFEVFSAAKGATINLLPSSSSSLAAYGTFSIDSTSIIENVLSGAGNDKILGNNANNYLDGGAGHDSISAGGGNDTIIGGDGNDTLLGSTGNDLIDGGVGKDVLIGDAGADIFAYHNQADFAGDLIKDFVSGVDKLDISGFGFISVSQGASVSIRQFGYSYDGSTTTLSNIDKSFVLKFTGDVRFTAKDFIGLEAGSLGSQFKGTSAAERTTGTLGDDVMFGEWGNDWLSGNSGNDLIKGGKGNDSLYGGAGIDALHGEWGNDLLEGGAGNDYLYGYSENDTLIGGAGADILSGGDGADLFRFTALADSYAKDATFDFSTGKYTYHSNTVDIITDFQKGVDKIDITKLGFTGIWDENGQDGSSLSVYFDGNDLLVANDDMSFAVRVLGASVLHESDFVGFAA